MNPIGWFKIYVEDLDARTAFYEKTSASPSSPTKSPCPILNAYVSSRL